MAVTVADLTAPTGELRTEWFTNPDLASEGAVWITLGEAKVPVGATEEQSDAVVTAYAYVRGYSDLLLRMSVDPNSVSIDKGDISVAFAKDQRDQIAGKVKYWTGALDAALDDAETAAVIEYDPPRASSSVQAMVWF